MIAWLKKAWAHFTAGFGRRFVRAMKYISGWKQDGELGSNWRRVFTRSILIGCCLLMIEAGFGESLSFVGGVFFASGLSLISLYFFIDVVVAVPFRSSDAFKVNVPRLFIDALASAAFMVFSFAAIYRSTGLAPETDAALDHVYFSAVTFSTLGFGDFRPLGAGKLFAALEAMLGNLHLGIIVAATFAAIQRQSKP